MITQWLFNGYLMVTELDLLGFIGISINMIYHLVIQHSHGKSLINGGLQLGQSSTNEPCSMAISNNWRVPIVKPFLTSVFVVTHSKHY